MNTSRRQFLTRTGAFGALLAAGCAYHPENAGLLVRTRSSANPGPEPLAAKPWFEVSLAEWSYHKAIFGKKMTHLDFPVVARRDHGLGAIELVNQFFMDKAANQAYLADYKRRCDAEGVAIKLIMCDGEGALGDPDAAKEAWQRFYFKGEFPEQVAEAPEDHTNKRRLKSPRFGG
jgi:hypothetical protein